MYFTGNAVAAGNTKRIHSIAIPKRFSVGNLVDGISLSCLLSMYLGWRGRIKEAINHAVIFWVGYYILFVVSEVDGGAHKITWEEIDVTVVFKQGRHGCDRFLLFMMREFLWIKEICQKLRTYNAQTSGFLWRWSCILYAKVIILMVINICGRVKSSSQFM